MTAKSTRGTFTINEIYYTNVCFDVFVCRLSLFWGGARLGGRKKTDTLCKRGESKATCKLGLLMTDRSRTVYAGYSCDICSLAERSSNMQPQCSSNSFTQQPYVCAAADVHITDLAVQAANIGYGAIGRLRCSIPHLAMQANRFGLVGVAIP